MPVNNTRPPCAILKRMILSMVIGAGCVAGLVGGPQEDPIIRHGLQFGAAQLKRSVVEFGDSLIYPRSTEPDGRWRTSRIREWTTGFFPGSLWYAFEATGDPFYRRAAERWTSGLESIKTYGGSHDIGFMVYCSFGNGYRLTNDPAYKEVILQTAQTLTTRFNPKVGCIRSWDNRKWEYPVIIDNMMNLELLFWSAKNGGTKQMYDIAFSHAERTMKNHFRDDGSTYHVLSYDTTDGTVKWKGTHQGFADSTAWARGQAWAIYGFTMTYRFTHDERFLNTARRAADYFITHLPAENVPYWDFQAPGIPNEPRDASAAAIAASALLELSTFVPEAASREKYAAAATSILTALSSSAYLADGSPSRGILNHSVGNMPSKGEVDVSIVYADYYYLEAIARYRNLRKVVADVAAIERSRVIKGAAEFMNESPLTITAFASKRSAGGAHDYFSEGDYWWPDPKNPDGPYVQRDGMTNPDNFVKHREVMFRFARAVANLTAAYKLTGEQKYAAKAVSHLKAWFLHPATKMNPHLLYAQAIKGKVTGRGTGIIDTIHLIEVARAVELLHGSKAFDPATEAAVKEWFRQYLVWMTTHQYGLDEAAAKNNHGTWWVAQVAAFSRLVGDTAQLAGCRARFKNSLMPDQMATDGSFPLELKRTKPYNYAIFNLEGFAVICQILSTPEENLWEFAGADGRSMRKGMEFLYPYLLDKSTWPFPKDVMHFEGFPSQRPMLLFAGIAFNEQKYIDLWKKLAPDPTDPEVQRNVPLRQPLLWAGGK